MELKQEDALRELNAALQKATECGLFDMNAGGYHPDIINNFCDAITETVKNTDFADRSHLLKDWTVRYGQSGLKFECQAEDIKHAIEQCENAYPGETIQRAYPGKLDAIPVKYWNATCYQGDEPHKEEFTMAIDDQRLSNGQMYVDIASADGNLDNILSLSLEINRLDGIDADMQCAHLHFDGDNVAMSIFKKGDAYILRPETDVTIKSYKLPNGEFAYVLE